MLIINVFKTLGLICFFLVLQSCNAREVKNDPRIYSLCSSPSLVREVLVERRGSRHPLGASQESQTELLNSCLKDKRMKDYLKKEDELTAVAIEAQQDPNNVALYNIYVARVHEVNESRHRARVARWGNPNRPRNDIPVMPFRDWWVRYGSSGKAY